MSDKDNELNDKLDETAVEKDDVETDATETDATSDAVVEASTDDATDVDVASIAFDVVYDDDDESDTAPVAESSETADAQSAAEQSDEGADSDIVTDNADHVNETLALRKTDDTESLDARATAASDSATSVSSRLDREIKRSKKKDTFFLKSNPTFALNRVTVTNRKTGRNILDDLSLAFQSGATYAVLVDAEDNEQHQALLATMVGMIRPDRGNVMNKSANLNEVEPLDVLGHRIGFIPQRFAVRGDLDAEGNILYAMDASNRNFLRPKPVIARELLKRVGFTEATSGLLIGKLSGLDQRRVAIARALCCEAEVIIADEPTAGLDRDDATEVLALLSKFKRDADRKRAIIVVTVNPEISDAMEHSVELE
ncbi:ATP-binding cassette domain-containing protein [Bifidobacterium moukalabense]|uniref:ATP-binding cassette domain-containing protein n=1 Tax=Bifidobacterium moukalabense TaxID=1333651 RepID=UPI0010F94279|nr:ATP-binding cassette domain-containing protein [Bifidobacterium moukalabense]